MPNRHKHTAIGMYLRVNCARIWSDERSRQAGQAHPKKRAKCTHRSRWCKPVASYMQRSTAHVRGPRFFRRAFSLEFTAFLSARDAWPSGFGQATRGFVAAMEWVLHWHDSRVAVESAHARRSQAWGKIMSAKHSAAVGALAASLIAALLHSHASADAIAPTPDVQSETFVASADVFSAAGVTSANITLASLANGRFIGSDSPTFAFTGTADPSLPSSAAASPHFSVTSALAYSPALSLEAAAFDRWLMLIVGAGLIAVQLRRKQRELRRPKLAI